MDDQKAIAILQWFDAGSEELEAAQYAISAIETLAKIRSEIERYRSAPNANAANSMSDIAQLLDPKP